MIEEKTSFKIIGISVRTSNVDGQSMVDIPALWNRFFAEEIMSKIPDRIGTTMYCIYTEYESDHLHPYTTLLGCEVDNLDFVPDGLFGLTIASGKYYNFEVVGDPSKGAVYNKWLEIWNSDIDRNYGADYEVYDERSKNGDNSFVDIFISVN